MAELAKTHIDVYDESTFATGINTLIPLYVIATKSNKVIDETTGEIALGTTKEFAGQVQIVTSQREVIDRYGIPYFAELNGTVLQGDERNEYGLYGLYDAMGTTSLAYVLRADIDLDQLSPREDEPRSSVKNGSYWIDLTNSRPGLFYAKRNSTDAGARPSTDWVAYDSISYVSEKPADNVGEERDIAIVFSESTGTETVYSKVGGKWEVAGTSSTNVYKSTSIEYPQTYSKNDLWLKTTAINGGASYSFKKWVASSETWQEVPLPVAKSYIDAEAALGSQLKENAMFLYVDPRSTEKNVNETIYVYVPSSVGLKLTATGAYVPPSTEKTITLKYVENGELKTINVTADSTSTIDKVIEAFEEAFAKNGSTAVHVEKDSGKLVIYSKIADMEVSESATSFGFAANQTGYQKSEVVWKSFTDLGTRAPKLYASENEPTETAKDGTMWFNDDLKVDIMVNNGNVWKGFNTYYSNQSNKPSIYVTSEEPSNPVDNSLWIDTDEDDYPTIKRWFAGDWEVLDNTDQSTPNGVVFADARYYAEDSQHRLIEPTYEVDDETGKLISPDSTAEIKGCNLLDSDNVDPDCVNPQTYPAGIILFNTRFSTNNVKEYKSNPFEGLYDSDTKKYNVGGYEGTIDETKLARWVSASGNAEDGSGLFGRKAQRRMVVNAMAGAIKSNEDIRTYDYDFFFATCPGYPELDDELLSLNKEKKEMFEIVTDCPARLEPNATKIQAWATNANNAVSHGADGRVLKNAYVVRNYPSMGLTSNVDGKEIAVPSSIAKMRNLLVLPRGQIAAGTQYGQVTNLASVGYITDEDEYASVVVKDGLGEVLISKDINPIMPRRNTGLLFWGERTENNVESSLSDEHAINTLLRLKRQLEAFCQPYFFRINTEALRADFERGIIGILNEYIATSELYDYAVSMERNTPETIQRRELWCDISIEISKGIEQIYIPIHVVATGSISGS